MVILTHVLVNTMLSGTIEWLNFNQSVMVILTHVLVDTVLSGTIDWLNLINLSWSF